MRLSTQDQFAVSGALASVQSAAAVLGSVHDADDARRALLTVRHAAMTAYGLITDAEQRARAAALAPYREVA